MGDVGSLPPAPSIGDVALMVHVKATFNEMNGAKVRRIIAQLRGTLNAGRFTLHSSPWRKGLIHPVHGVAALRRKW
jgi:hypothetical protein